MCHTLTSSYNHSALCEQQICEPIEGLIQLLQHMADPYTSANVTNSASDCAKSA